MNSPLRILPLVILAPFLLHAADLGPRGVREPARYVLLAADADKVIAAVRATDDARVTATKAGNGGALGAIFSDDLRYAHSSGHVDTKASLIDALASRRSIYESYEYKERNFLPIAPGVVLMTGRALIRAGSATAMNDLDLNFLAVWREENGHWRFVAWQSCKNPPPAPAVK